MEYFFCDTGKELRETYEFLTRLEGILGKKIVRLNDQMGFDYWLKVYGNYLPSSKMRWCTRQLKIKPFEKWIGSDKACLYVAIRADEADRQGYTSTKPTIRATFPFRDEGKVKADIVRILREAGLDLPAYYEWRTRSGCYFCFFQRKMEWVNLKDRHPDLYEMAKKYEKEGDTRLPGFTWSQGESLSDLEGEERVVEIKRKHNEAVAREKKRRANLPLMKVLGQEAAGNEVFADVLDDENDDLPCVECTI
jgi:hypothetical protein